jgi:hypothetical protein
LFLARVLPEIQSSQQEKADAPVQEWRPAPSQQVKHAVATRRAERQSRYEEARQLATTRAERSTHCTSARHDRTDGEALAPAGDRPRCEATTKISQRF